MGKFHIDSDEEDEFVRKRNPKMEFVQSNPIQAYQGIQGFIICIGSNNDKQIINHYKQSSDENIEIEEGKF